MYTIYFKCVILSCKLLFCFVYHMQDHAFNDLLSFSAWTKIYAGVLFRKNNTNYVSLLCLRLSLGANFVIGHIMPFCSFHVNMRHFMSLNH
jgi:hypothetical protein